MRILEIVISALLILGMPSKVFSQEKGNPLRFEEISFDLGEVMDNAGSVSHTFHFKNIGEKKVAILDITTSCSCLTVQYDRKPLSPGEERELVLTFDPSNFSSEVEVSAKVYTDCSGRHPAQTLSMKSLVRIADQWKHLPCKIGNLRLKRTRLSIGEVTRDNLRRERIPCANAGKRPMEVTGQMLPDYARLSTDPSIIPPGTEADLWIEIDGKKISGMRDRSKEVHFKVLLQGTGGSVASRMIEVVVQPIEK